MNWLTDGQKEFLIKQEIKVGNVCMLPRWGFAVYGSPEYGDYQWLDTNPFTKSLDDQPIKVLEVQDNFIKVEFLKKRRKASTPFWLLKSEIEVRSFTETVILTILCAIPFTVYNLFKGHYK